MTTATTPSRSKFCRTNAPSRETAGAGARPAPRLDRKVSRSAEKTTHANRNPRNQGPIALIAKVCTDGTTPLRMLKVPKTARKNATIKMTKFHKRRGQLLSLTFEEGMYVV